MRPDRHQDAVSVMGSLASGYCQVASGYVRMTSGKCQNGIRMASGSVSLASGWRQIVMMVRRWRQDSVRPASEQRQDSVRMAQPGPDGISGC